MTSDLIIFNIGELVTCSSDGRPKRGESMREIGLIRYAAVAIKDGKIIAVGSSDELREEYQGSSEIDGENKVVCPGFVDPHTHIVYAGDRFDEFECKIQGREYLEILQSGGGIISTVSKTRAASVDDLFAQSKKRLDKMLECGTTTGEVKTGYGLDPATEMKMLEVIALLQQAHPVRLVPTFLAAHALPPEFKDNANVYVNLICETMLSEAWRWFVGSPFHGKTPFFCDVFCEKGAFDLAQTKRILETARSLGYRLKAHVDEFTNMGGSRLAIEMGAESIDHLDEISDDEIKLLSGSNTVGVVTPTVNFNFGSSKFADARKLIDAGCTIALSTDYNPGSAPTPSQPAAMAIACRYQKLLPAEALNAATINAAFAIGLGGKVGSIEVGKEADLLMIDADDHRQLAHEFGGNLVSRVIKAGKAVPIA